MRPSSREITERVNIPELQNLAFTGGGIITRATEYEKTKARDARECSHKNWTVPL